MAYLKQTPLQTLPKEHYEIAFNVLLKHECGYTNNPSDPGGPTNFGITQNELTRCHKQLKLPSDVKELTKEQARIYYKSQWWDKYNYKAINSLYMATKIFDMAVNMGSEQAHTLAQRSANSCGHHLVVDGVLGPKSIAALNEIYVHNRESDFKVEIREEQASLYNFLVVQNPKLKIFLRGWLKRASY